MLRDLEKLLQQFAEQQGLAEIVFKQGAEDEGNKEGRRRYAKQSHAIANDAHDEHDQHIEDRVVDGVSTSAERVICPHSVNLIALPIRL